MAKKVINIVSTVIVVIFVAFAVLLVGVRAIGFTPFAILSPSMSPKYMPGDLIYVKNVPPEKIKKGDVLTFVISDNTVVTHRVDDVDREKKCFYTKGDANTTRDTSPVYYDNTLGVVKFSIPKLGYVSNFISTKNGRYIAGACIVVLILLFLLPEFFKGKDDKGKHSKVDKNNV